MSQGVGLASCLPKTAWPPTSEEEDEICSWEEMVRLESIGAVTQKLASVPRGNVEPLLTEDCPESERIRNRFPDSNAE